GPIGRPLGAAGAGGAPKALGLPLRTRVFGRCLVSVAAALMIVVARGFAAARVCLERLLPRARSSRACMAALVSPNRGLAALGTATVATISLLRAGSR